MTNTRHAALAAAALSCLSFAVPAVAQERMAVTASVRTADLDLSSPAGLRTLRSRLRGAIARSCTSAVPGLAGMADANRCGTEMRASAERQVAALHAGTPSVRVAAR